MQFCRKNEVDRGVEITQRVESCLYGEVRICSPEDSKDDIQSVDFSEFDSKCMKGLIEERRSLIKLARSEAEKVFQVRRGDKQLVVVPGNYIRSLIALVATQKSCLKAAVENEQNMRKVEEYITQECKSMADTAQNLVRLFGKCLVS